MRLRENKGVMLIVTFLVVSVLLVLSGAYVVNTIVQNRSVLQQKESQTDFYAAEKGIEYAYREYFNDTDFS